MWRRSQQTRQQVTNGRFEIERDGHVAFLDYSLGGGVLRLLHTEVPDQLQGRVLLLSWQNQRWIGHTSVA